MAIKIRPNPSIPDHEVLRKIGGGAYGEVWLARGVTGALRAVKVVWREDFEDIRSFEREFEGILKFEPMSRDHPALVNILHVGRSPDGVSFYYYVMEIGDDMTSGQDINPIEYEPRTLRADNHQGAGLQWETGVCIDVGLRLAEALDHLHERGLAHRDVKPSNVIFVNGRAKLADIGLVAARGQRTFVGTEGFVPPEGPGSAQADVYSLGKVLYEIATGKDRLLFPELPDEMPARADRKRWLELNKIICDICDPRISKRKITTAADLADALRRLQRGKRRRQSGFAVAMTTLILTGFTGWATWETVKDSAWVRSLIPVRKPVQPLIGMLRVVSAPEGAEVTDAKGQWVGTTNTGLIPVTVGDEYSFMMKKSGYRPYKIVGKVPASVVTEPFLISANLANFSPPQAGEKWEDQLGNFYQPMGKEHVSSNFVTRKVWTQFTEATKRTQEAFDFVGFSENGQAVEVALCSASDAVAFCEWFQNDANQAGFLTEDQEVRPQQESTFETPTLSERARRDGLKPFRLLVRQIAYGEITLRTHLPDVQVYMKMNSASDPSKRVWVGATHDSLLIQKVKPGVWHLELEHEGYKTLEMDLTVHENEKMVEDVNLAKSRGVVFGKLWENGLGMRFAPLGQDLMVSIWETRVVDYQCFVRESGRNVARPAYFPQTSEHPVVNVSREDAQEFCKWLTERERVGGWIAQTHEYRLPTDLEWSLMVGLEEEEGISPGWRDSHKPMIYPWGGGWPPDEKVGNFADATAVMSSALPIERTISDYHDGFDFTAPVGSFPANSKGFYDLSGNVQEWVGDDYTKIGKNLLGVLRGGGWNTYHSENLLAGARNAVPSDFKDAIYGFRVVLAKVIAKPND